MGRMRGCLWLTAGLIVAILAAFVSYITISRAAARGAGQQQQAGPKVSVVVAARPVPVRAALGAQDLQLKELPVEAVPEGALRELKQAEGKITLVDLYQGEVLLSQRLLAPNVVSGDGRLALILAEDEVLMAIPAQDLMSKIGVLKPGDHVDLLFSFDFPLSHNPVAQTQGTAAGGEDTEKVTFNLLQNVTIAGIVGGPQRRAAQGIGGAVEGAGAQAESTGPVQAILITISPQDALLLKHMRDAGGVPDLVLRAPRAEQPFTTEPVDVDYVIERFKIPLGIPR